MPPKLAPSAQSPPLRRSPRTAATPSSSNPSDRDLLQQIADLHAEKQYLSNELARQRIAHENQTKAMRKEMEEKMEEKEVRLRQVGQFLEVLERMDREQAEEEGWSVAEDGDGDEDGERGVVRVKRLR